jgi:hypothetical protein
MNMLANASPFNYLKMLVALLISALLKYNY